MHGYSRLGTGRSVNATTTPSPPSSPRLRRKSVGSSSGGGRGSGGGCPGGGGGGSGSGRGNKQGFVERLVLFLVSVVVKRRGVFLFAPVLYISGMLLYMGSLSLDVNLNLENGGVVMRKRLPPASVYRSPQVFEKIWPYMEAENGSSELPESNGFLIIEANGGLNQQRLSICDAVAVAGLLNTTLVIPIFHLNSVWRDSSKFGDIFDEDFFIDVLKNKVHVIRELPIDVLEQFDNSISSIINLRVKAWSSPTYYLQKVLPKLVEMRFAYAVPRYVHGLRCSANFEALRFSEPITLLAKKMVERMISNSLQSGGRYVSVHLRFEEDVVALSCCEYGGGEEEKLEMNIAQERSWRGKFRKRGGVIKPGANRIDGKCPLTPLEVEMMLRGMGFDNLTSVYIAAGNIYKAEKYMAPLKQMFPRLESKETLASTEELAPFKGHLLRLAVLDYTVCLHSEVFVTTQGGNFPHFLMGHRRYLYGGHAKTFKPDKRKLALLFDKPNIKWQVFERQMQGMLRHSDIKGSETRKPSASLYTFPMPDCMCKQPETKHEENTRH